MLGHTIIVLGISGVGKTTACEQFVNRHKRYIHFFASQLLKEATGMIGEQLRISDEATIRSNQALLGRVLDEKRLEYKDRPILIDAHSVIDNDRKIVVVPVETISSLKPDALIFLEEEPQVIFTRRAKSNRFRPTRSIAKISAQQLLAKSTAIDYSVSLGLPISCGKIKGLSDLEALIRNCHIKVAD